MKRAFFLPILLACAATVTAMNMPSFHTKGSPTGGPTGPLKHEDRSLPARAGGGAGQHSPADHQRLSQRHPHIGRSSVSTGAKGHSTPSGVFTILVKKREHYSKTYNIAPMPNMQRLTWQGVAIHSGNLPGYPASHGCACDGCRHRAQGVE